VNQPADFPNLIIQAELIRSDTKAPAGKVNLWSQSVSKHADLSPFALITSRRSCRCVNLAVVTRRMRGVRGGEHGERSLFEAIGGAVSAFSDAAMAGQVSIQADAAAEALDKIGKVKDQLTQLLQGSGSGNTEVMLGANPVGQAMAKKSMGRYDGDDSFIASLTLLAEQTAKAETALKRCITNYVDTDELHAAQYNRTHQ